MGEQKLTKEQFNQRDEGFDTHLLGANGNMAAISRIRTNGAFEKKGTVSTSWIQAKA